MAIVSDIPFKLLFVRDYPQPVFDECILFWDSINEAYSSSTPTIAIEENDPISIVFEAQCDARLYLDALDIVPDSYGCAVDENGKIYHGVTATPLPLYRLDSNEFDELRVDNHIIEVISEGHHYFGWMQINPKQLSSTEWEMMVSDLEKEAIGLSQDIVQRNIGFGEFDGLAIPPKQLRQFLIFQKNARRFEAALFDVAENPRFYLVTNYVRTDRSREIAMDTRSIREELRRPNQGKYLIAPHKEVNYDTQNNRYLKKIIKYCFRQIKDFNDTMEYISRVGRQNGDTYSARGQYRRIFTRNITQYHETSERLLKMMNIVEQEEWYSLVSDISNGRVTHAFSMDSSCSFINKVYHELQREEFNVTIDPYYSFSWKKSSQLYEVWSFIAVCRILGKQFAFDEKALIRESGNGTLFPILENGKQVEFLSEDTRLIVSYNRRVPTSLSECYYNIDPYCYDMTNGDDIIHNIPDIRIDMYSQKHKMYIGSIVLECKYRKIRNFYSNNTYNSYNQINSYYECASTNLYFGELSQRHDIRPVTKVIVLTPDEGFTARRRVKNVILRKFRPADKETNEALSKILFDEINTQIHKV